MGGTGSVDRLKAKEEPLPVTAQASSGSDLADRRQFHGKALPLNLKSFKVSWEGVTRLQTISPRKSKDDEMHSVRIKRHIRWEKNFSKHYTLGEEVMPSVHPSMKILHAMRLKDSEPVVIKVRGKGGSFETATEEKEWRVSTEFMMNLPRSEGIAQVYEVLEDSHKYYVVMERVDGADLFETLDRDGALPIEECKDIIRQLLGAVEELHKKGIIHKDLKLENVMVSRQPSVKFPTEEPLVQPVSSFMSPRSPKMTRVNSRVKLIDFDTAEEVSPTRSSRCVVGTDQYIAQEAYEGKYSPSSDIFAVGVIAYRLLSGRFPFRSDMFDDEAGENWVGSPKMKCIQKRLQKYRINYNLKPFKEDEAALNFCSSLLAVDENERPTATVALKHHFLNEEKEKKVTEEPILPGAIADSPRGV